MTGREEMRLFLKMVVGTYPVAALVWLLFSRGDWVMALAIPLMVWAGVGIAMAYMSLFVRWMDR